MSVVRKPWNGGFVELNEKMFNRTVELISQKGISGDNVNEIADILEVEFELSDTSNRVALCILIAACEHIFKDI